jgi:hypothetical protein
MENFFDYIEKRYSFKAQQNLMLLEYAAGNGDKALRILKEEIEGKGKKLKAYYPGFEKLDLSKYDTVGTILDGVLLIEK